MSSLSSIANSTVANSLITNTPTVAGLASGLDTNKIIQGLVAIQQAQITALQNNASKVTAQQTAFKGVEARLLALQAQLSGLSRTQDSVFDVRTTTSSSTDLLGAAANSSATPGIYNLRVNQLAVANQIASQGYDSATAAISQGTLQIGSGATSTTITIDSTNNTLQGLASAINNARVGVSVSIVNDGSGAGNQPFRLVLTANKTGVANSVTITNSLAADSSGIVKPVFNATYVGPVNNAAGYSGTATATANTGAGNYTGASNNDYTFTVVNGGIVGADDGLQLSYTDSTGAHTGTITLNSGDVGVAKSVAQGIQVQFAAGTLVAGQSFSVKAYVPTLQQAADASLTLGSGTGALTVNSATNTVDNLISGVTLNLLGADPNKTISLEVAANTGQAGNAIETFVSDFNDLMSFIDQQTSFDAQTGTAGALLGNFQISQIQDQFRNAVGSLVNNVNSNMNHLGSLGITFNQQGQLTLDHDKLANALNGQIPGVTLDDIHQLFSLSATSSNPGIQFVGGSVKTRGSAAPYQVSITQAAQQASITATNALANSIVVDNTNNALTFNLDGLVSGTIQLTAGTYTQATLAQELQKQINAQSGFNGRTVTVGVLSGKLAITSNSYGSTSKAAIGAGSALASLGFAGTETGSGLDVAGSFMVNGATEIATGSGQLLTGNSSNANTVDLAVNVSLTSAQVGAGLQANLTVTRGLGATLDAALTNLLDPVNGRLKSVDDGFQAIQDSIKQEIDRQNTALLAKQQALQEQFTAMETAIAQMQSIGNYLTMQFDNLQQSSQKR